jgi:glutathione S-transferase/maleylpyruvate isomerase
MLVLHAIPVSLYSAKLRLVLRAKGLNWEERPPDGGYGSAEWLARIPSGNLPVLVHGDLTIADSEAAAEYLNEVFPDPALLPADPAARAQMRMRGRFHDTRLEPELRRLFPHIRPARRDAAAVAAQAAALQLRLDQLGRLLDEAPALDFGLGDCGLVVTVHWLDVLNPALGLGLQQPESLVQWRARMLTLAPVRQELGAYLPVLHGWLAEALA